MRMFKKIILLHLLVFLFAIYSNAQQKIDVTIDGNASETAKEMAKDAIVSKINNSADFQVQTSNKDITIAATINKAGGNFEVLYNVNYPLKSYKKSYASTTAGYTDFEEVITNKVGQILSELPITKKAVAENKPTPKKTVQADDEVELEREHLISKTKYTPNGKMIYLSKCGIYVDSQDWKTKVSWGEAMYSYPDGYRLPTSKELQCMCYNKSLLPYFNESEYWSATEKNTKTAYSITTNDCEVESDGKHWENAVRLVIDK